MQKGTVVKNSLWIIICKIVQSVFALIINMLIARYLGPSSFGVINYAASIVAFLLPLMHLGISSTLVQELISSPENEGKIMGTSIFLCFLSSIVCVIGLAGFVLVANANEAITIVVCLLYSLSLVAQSLEMIQYWFQAKLLSKYVSIISLIAYIVVAGYRAVLLFLKTEVYWFALSYAIDYTIIAVFAFIVYKKLGGQKMGLSWEWSKQILSKSKYYIIADLMISVFAQTDKIMLKFMIGDSAVGYYSAAVTITGMTAFVFKAIIDSFRPVIVEQALKDKESYEKNVTRLYSIVIYLTLAQSVVFTVFSRLIVYILYGNEFMPSIGALQIIAWYTTFSYFGTVRNVWILAEKKYKLVLPINVFGAIANVVLNFIMIPICGLEGAAIASLITQVFMNFILGFIMKDIRPNNRLMMKAFNPKNLLDMLKLLFKKRAKKIDKEEKVENETN